MSVTDDVKQAVQAFLVPELDAIKAQILAQRHETAESMARMETRLESRMDRIESRLDRQNDKLDQILMMLAPHTKAAGG